MRLKLPRGFRYAAVYAGIRKRKKNDLGLIVSDLPAAAAAVFTTNRVQAAPVRLARRHLRESGGVARAILANAGNANCATRTGDRVALASCLALARRLKIPVREVLPASTGVIGVELPGRLILDAIPALCARLKHGRFAEVARAILTTDTTHKTAAAEMALSGGTVRIAGMTKGAGMIHPRMATTLAFLVTDASLAPAALRAMLREATESSYHRLSVDGDTSTNDMAAILANGASGIRPAGRDRTIFGEALAKVMEELASQIAGDGEGARKRITILVSGARSVEDAARMARAIANSPLVKTAIAGADPNWGRILSAAGSAGVALDPSRVDISLQNVTVCRGGLAASFSEKELKGKLAARECLIRFAIRGPGRASARFWTCDLTEDYIRINASYRT